MSKKYEELGSSRLDRLFYSGAHSVVGFIGKLAVNYETLGAENLPLQGRALIVSNHLNWSDVLFVPSAIPERHVVVIGRRKYMEMPILGAVFKRWGAVVIDRGMENPGREALRNSLETIKRPLTEDREVLAFASPNTRTPGLKPGLTSGGIARASYETESDVYAAVIKGSDRLKDRAVTVMFSPSLGHPESDSPKERKEYLRHIHEVQTEMFDSISHPYDYQVEATLEPES